MYHSFWEHWFRIVKQFNIFSRFCISFTELWSIICSNEYKVNCQHNVEAGNLLYEENLWIMMWKMHLVHRTFNSNNILLNGIKVMGQGMGRRIFLLITITVHVVIFRIVSKSAILRFTCSYLTFLDFHKAVVFQCAYMIFCTVHYEITFCTEWKNFNI